MSRDWRLYVSDIRDHVRFIQKVFSSIDNIEEYVASDIKQLAIERAFEIIGEAAKPLPDEIKAKYPDINWRAIIGMRDQLAHGYHKIDEEIIWNAAQTQLEPLRVAIEEMLKI